MRMRTSFRTALALSSGIHIFLALALWAVPCEEDRNKDSAAVLDEYVLAGADAGETVPAATQAQPTSGTDQPRERTQDEKEGEFSSVVKELLPREPTEPGSYEVKSEGRSGGTGGQGLRVDASSESNSDGKVSFCGVASSGTRVAYVIDRSLSMGLNGTFQRAREELFDSLDRLPSKAQFQIILYNRRAEIPNGSTGLLPADKSTTDRMKLHVNRFRPGGSTDHVEAFRAALHLHSDTIFFATDGDEMTQATVDAVTAINKGRSIIHTIEVTRLLDERRSLLLKRLAEANGGTYRAVVVKP